MALAAVLALLLLVPLKATADTTPPDTFILSGPSGVIGQSQTPAFTYSSDDPTAHFECRLWWSGIFNAWASCPSGGIAYNVGPGDYIFGVRAIDGAGNIDPSPAERYFFITSLEIVPWEPPPAPASWPGSSYDPAPFLGIDGPYTVRTRRNKVRITFRFDPSEPVAFECKLDRGPFNACASPFTTRRLGPGRHRLLVAATDESGKRSTETHKFKVVRRR